MSRVTGIRLQCRVCLGRAPHQGTAAQTKDEVRGTGDRCSDASARTSTMFGCLRFLQCVHVRANRGNEDGDGGDDGDDGGGGVKWCEVWKVHRVLHEFELLDEVFDRSTVRAAVQTLDGDLRHSTHEQPPEQQVAAYLLTP